MTAGRPASEVAWLVVANVAADHEIRRKADEPGILLVVGGARLAGDRLTYLAQHGRGAALHDALHHRGDLERGHRVEHLLAPVDQCGLGLAVPFIGVTAAALARVVPEDRVAVPILDAVDQSCLDPTAAIGKHGIGLGHSQHRSLAGAERERQIGRQVIVDAEPLGVFGDQRHADVLGKPHRHDVARVLDAEAQGLRPVIFSGRIIFRPPWREPGALVDLDRRVHHHRRRRIAVIERRRVDERLERGTGLAQRLRGAVELALVVREASDKREHPAGQRFHHNEPARHFGKLTQPILRRIFAGRLHINHVARRQHLAHPRDELAPLGSYRRLRPLHAIERNDADLTLPGDRPAGLAPGLQADARRLVAGFEHDRQSPRRDIGQSLDVGELGAPVARHVELDHRTPPALRLVEMHETVVEGFAGHHLHLGLERRAHRQPALVELLLTVVLIDVAANLLGKIFCRKDVRAGRPLSNLQAFFLVFLGVGR